MQVSIKRLAFLLLAVPIAASTARSVTAATPTLPAIPMPDCDSCQGTLATDAGLLSIEYPKYDSDGNFTGIAFVRASITFTPGDCIPLYDESSQAVGCLQLGGCSAKIGLSWNIADAPCFAIGFCLPSPNSTLCVDEEDFPCEDCEDFIGCSQINSNPSAYTIVENCGDSQEFTIPIASSAFPPDQAGNPRGAARLFGRVECSECDA